MRQSCPCFRESICRFEPSKYMDWPQPLLEIRGLWMHRSIVNWLLKWLNDPASIESNFSRHAYDSYCIYRSNKVKYS